MSSSQISNWKKLKHTDNQIVVTSSSTAKLESISTDLEHQNVNSSSSESHGLQLELGTYDKRSANVELVDSSDEEDTTELSEISKNIKVNQRIRLWATSCNISHFALRELFADNSYDELFSDDENKEPSIFADSGSEYLPSNEESSIFTDSGSENIPSEVEDTKLYNSICANSPNIEKEVCSSQILINDVIKGTEIPRCMYLAEIPQNFTPQKFEFQNSFSNPPGNWNVSLKRLNDAFSKKKQIIIHSDITLQRVTQNNKNDTQTEKKEIKSNKSIANQVSDPFQSPFLLENKYKKTICQFCDSTVVSKHFARHLERNHVDLKEVREIFLHKAGSLERKRLLALVRNVGNLDVALKGHIIPKKLQASKHVNESDYAICKHCSAYFKRLCLSRHMKNCFAKKPNATSSTNCNVLSESLIYSVSKKKIGETLNKLEVKTAIFSKMQADAVTTVAINDILLIMWGEDLLKKTKNNRSLYYISNKLRECAKFLIEIRKLGSFKDMLSTLKPENFDNAIKATKKISRYDIENRTFGAASLALHFGTTLKKLSDLATKLILRKKIPLPITNVETCLKDLERFKGIVDSQWTTEVGSLALKDLNEKAAVKPKLLPITEDIMNLKKFVENCAEESYNKLKSSKLMDSYRTLVETTLILTILHNRKRVGDIQYLDITSYDEQINRSETTVQSEMVSSLSENEKILTKHYQKIVSIGKGSRPVTVLIPRTIHKFFTLLHQIRKSTTWFLDTTTSFLIQNQPDG
ncbi:unnamed protein product [Brassicogethes aeneus]|uniref:Uncharacterized protein n=1 Tax=Brassicogethes aeneus TaxID=1431903 RepID=A0A9P0FDU6_BRAAE|nr:unnamed protein product [Brassicogethes aeneus]